MKINLASSAGFCSGVKRALKIALELSKTGKNIEMLGDIVHNEDVVKEIEKSGIKKIKMLKKGSDKTLLVRAHGAAKHTLERAARLGYKIVDATCPMVKEIHRIVSEMEKEGYQIIIIGDKKHDEVQGIAGQLKTKAMKIDTQNDIPKNPKHGWQRSCVVVQSTQQIEKALKIVKILETRIPELKFFNTICLPTRIKQEEIKTLPLKNDVIIVIGSKKSANSKRLYEISRSLNKRTYWVQSKDEIKPWWLKKAKTVGITSGASTPDATTKEIIKYIRSIT
jgi:4-hydroxy-3-methylbut-2-enyl diphosphate reductase